jgi:hypothetical protein
MDLEREASHFAQSTDELLRSVLPGDLPEIRALQFDDRFAVHAGTSTEPQPIPVLVDEEHLASLIVSYRCIPDSSGRYLAVSSSRFVLLSLLTKAPLLRLEYGRNLHTAPAAHWLVHAERGAFSHLLAHAGTPAPHDLSSLHLPVGGGRARPCLEDFLQFLVQECGVDSAPGWRAAILAGRELWRRRQIAAMVRDAPSQAERVLTELGYAVTAPSGGQKADNVDALCRW